MNLENTLSVQYPRLDVKITAGALASFPIDLSKTILSAQEFMQDPYILSLKPGVVITMSKTQGFVVPAGKNATDIPLGILVNAADGYMWQNINALATGLITALVGNGNQFVTDNVVDTDITVGAPLYANSNGMLTITKGTLETPIAVALSANSATNKTVLCQQLC